MYRQAEPSEFVDVIATQPAKINGISPPKYVGGSSDADIVIFDPSYEGVIRLADNPNGVDYNLYEVAASPAGWRPFCCGDRW